MTTASGDDVPPEDSHAAAPSGRPPAPPPDGEPHAPSAPAAPSAPSAPSGSSGPAAPAGPAGPSGPWTSTETLASPKPPQAWFAPSKIPPGPAADEEPTADGAATSDPAGRLVHACLIAASTVMLLSVFLPWASWSITVLHGAGLITVPDQVGGGRVVYGMSGNDGLIVVLAGMAALALAIAAQAAHAGFAPYAAVPGGLALVAIFHQGLTLGDDDTAVARSLSWGYWIAVVAALAVVAFGLAAAARPRPPQP